MSHLCDSLAGVYIHCSSIQLPEYYLCGFACSFTAQRDYDSDLDQQDHFIRMKAQILFTVLKTFPWTPEAQGVCSTQGLVIAQQLLPREI